MRNRINQIVLIIAVAMIFAATQAKAAVILIDDFASGVNLSTFGTNSAVDDGPHAGVLGGYRDTAVNAPLGGLNVFYSPVVGNTIAFDALAGSSGTYSSIYDGPGLGGDLGQDLLGIAPGGNFSLSIVKANGNGAILVTVRDGSDRVHSSYKSFTNGFVGVLNFNYGEYLGTGVDLSDVKNISLIVASGGVANDFTIGIFTATQVVPEPASLSLLGLGALVMLRRRKRQRAA
ncbi:PEP-CTERM sorting domain-containing protein [bacterium AH-315-I18]|nr:PEP-CTERM sorting domain-containing protein [Phycisphaeraceae bacterium]MBN4060962.1 PEP-CTERM sorting domain-containing protein [bacterium AH-315-I18]